MKNPRSTLTKSRIFSASIVMLTCLVSNAIPAQTASLARTFSLDSRIFGRTHSNDAVANFGIDVLNLATLPTRLIEPNTKLRNAGQGVLLLVGSTVLGQAFQLAYHEFGHGTRTAAVGLRPRYGFGTLYTAEDIEAALRAPPEHESFFGYFLESLFNDTGYALVSPGDPLFPPPSDEELVGSGWAVLLTAGGLNNEMLFSERIEDEIYQNGGHIGFFTTYVNGKLAASQYDLDGPTGDVGNTVLNYQVRGFDIDKSRIDSASRTAFFLSSMSYQLIYQTLRTFTGKSIRFTAWEVGGLQLPNTSFYMTRSGLSYKVRSGYRMGEWRFPFAVEHVFEGDDRTEVTLGAEKEFEKFTAAFETTLGERFECAMDVSYRQSKRVTVSGGYALYDQRNLHGERLIPSLEGGSIYHDFHAGVSLAY